MTRRADPIPDRLRGAGLAMVLPTLIVAAMPIGLLLGANFDRGIGLTFLGGSIAIVTPMLTWLAPLAAATFVVGLFVYFGRQLRADRRPIRRQLRRAPSAARPASALTIATATLARVPSR